MSKVEFKGIPALEKKITETFGKVVESTQMRNEVGAFVTDRLQAEARRARPLNDERAFPPLKKTSVIIREALSRTNSTHITYKAGRSNLTFSGQLIDAIVYTLKQGGRIVIEVASNMREPYIQRDRLAGSELKGLRKNIGSLKSTSKFVTKTKGKSAGPMSNKDLDRDLRRRGFVLYTAKGIESDERVGKRINNIVKKFVRRAIKINFDG